MFKKILAALALVLISISAFAQFGTWGYDNNTRIFQPPGVVVNQQGGSFVSAVPIANSAILAAQPVGARGAPTNCQVIEKTTWQRISGGAGEAVIKGIGLGLLGAAADRIGRTGGRWTEVGLIGGAGVGFLEGSADKYTMVCHNPSNQPSGTASNSSQGTGGYMCFVQGMKNAIAVGKPSDCADVAALVAAAKVGATPSSQEVAPTAQREVPAVFTPKSEGEPAPIAMTCYVKDGEGTYRFNAVDGVKIARDDCNAILAKQRPLPPLKSMSISF